MIEEGREKLKVFFLKTRMNISRSGVFVFLRSVEPGGQGFISGIGPLILAFVLQLCFLCSESQQR